MFCKKDVLQNFAETKGKHLCRSLFFDKIAVFRPATLLKKALRYRYFPTNFAKMLRILFFIEHLRCLLLLLINDGEVDSVTALTHSFPMHPFSTPWKHQKTLRFSDVFRGQKKCAFGTNGLGLNVKTFCPNNEMLYKNFFLMLANVF